MGSFTINLTEPKAKGKKFRQLLILLSAIFIVTGVLLYLISLKVSSVVFFILLGLYVLQFAYFIYLLFSGSRTQLFINGDEYALEYQFSMLRKVPEQVIWQTINKVRLGPTYMSFFKRSGRKKVVPLGWMPYARVVEIKEKVRAICDEKGIAVEVAEYKVG